MRKDFKNIALIGMRCTGKSGTGIELAKRLDFEFIDIDKKIEEKSRKTISEITNNGKNWLEFRKFEIEILEKYIKQDRVVISCGGGIGVCDEINENGKSLAEIGEKVLIDSVNTCKILLKSEISKIISRYQRDKKGQVSRPTTTGLLFDQDLILQDYNRRKKYEKIATFSIDTTNAEDAFFAIIDEIVIKMNKKNNAVIGYPVKHSMSPMLHKACYKDLKIDDKYDFLAIEVRQGDIENLRKIILENNLYGISVTAPLKEVVIDQLDEIMPCAKACDAVNTIVRDEKNRLIGYNTDYIGVLNSLLDKFDGKIDDKKIAILGSGGAAKACCFALKDYLKNTIIFARNIKVASEIGSKFGMKSDVLYKIKEDDFDIIINATSCGHKAGEKPISTGLLSEKHTIFELIYNPIKTDLVKGAIESGASVIYGTQMLVNQAIKQFQLYTGLDPNKKTMLDEIEFLSEKKLGVEAIMDKVFISIFADNIIDLEKKFKDALKITKNIEIRADFIKEIGIETVEKIAEFSSNANVIFTCRKTQHGGGYFGDEYDKIMKFAHRNFSYIDIDFDDIELINYLKAFEGLAKIICSKHCYEKTPFYRDCIQYAIAMSKSSADIHKLAFYCNEYSDINAQFQVFEYSDKLALVPMGNIGRLMRLYAILMQSVMSFVCLSESEKTANGQMTYKEFYEFVNMFYFPR